MLSASLASSSESRRNHRNVLQRICYVFASGMLHKLGRGEWASMADTNDADLCFCISVQEPGNGLPIGAVPSCRNTGHLWEGRGIGTRSFRLWRLAWTLAARLCWTGFWILRCNGQLNCVRLGFWVNFFGNFCWTGLNGAGQNWLLVTVCGFSIIGFGSRLYLVRGNTMLGLSQLFASFWFAVTWSASSISAAATCTNKRENMDLVLAGKVCLFKFRFTNLWP